MNERREQESLIEDEKHEQTAVGDNKIKQLLGEVYSFNKPRVSIRFALNRHGLTLSGGTL